MKRPPLKRTVFAAGATTTQEPKSRRAAKAAEDERLLTYVDATKKEIEEQLRERNHPTPATEAERLAAETYGYSVEAIRKKKFRTKKRKADQPVRRAKAKR